MPPVTAGVLPASGREVRLREPAGADELYAIETDAPASQAVLQLARRMSAAPQAGDDWGGLPAVDLGAIALLVRRAWLGETIRAHGLCTAPGCAEPFDVSFAVGEYLEHHRPRRARGVHGGEPGWFALEGSEVSFRVPTIADLDGGALLARCVRPADPPPALVRRIERALEAIAPRLDGELAGSCPECGAHVQLHFDPVSYVLAEVREASSGLLAQVHDLACGYHWSEWAILALPRRRRHGYVALIRQEAALV